AVDTRAGGRWHRVGDQDQLLAGRDDRRSDCGSRTTRYAARPARSARRAPDGGAAMTRPVLLALLALAGCDWSLSRMNDQPRCEPGDRTPWLPDYRCDQDPPPGTVPWRPQPAN